MDDALDIDARFAQIAAEEAKRTLVCTAETAAGIRASLADEPAVLGRYRFEEVRADLLPTPHTVLVVDDQALEAVAREAAQRLGTVREQPREEWWRHPRLPWGWTG